jgi:hypothetical protein
LNGSQTVYSTSSTIFFQSSVTGILNQNTPVTVTGYPALFPSLSWGIDTTAAAPANYYTTQVDFYGFEWNPGIAAKALQQSPNNSRYWLGS